MAKSNKPSIDLQVLAERAKHFNLSDIPAEKLAKSLIAMNPSGVQFPDPPTLEVRSAVQNMRPGVSRFHGAKVSKAWFPSSFTGASASSNKFGYLTPAAVRNNSKLPFNATTQALLDLLGNFMAMPDPGGTIFKPDIAIPAGFTYFGQFVDHDITLDTTTTLTAKTNATSHQNMRTPAFELDSVYGRGPSLDPALFVFPTAGPPTAIKFLLGTNTNVGPGGSGGIGGAGGMVVNTDADLPRVSSMTAVIGDPRNDENLIVSQLHTAFLKFHNRVVDMLVLSGFPSDIYVEARKLVRYHYQWCLLNDYARRICGDPAINDALANVNAPINSAFSMPVEFSVAAYRFGHSVIRDNYWVNFNFTNASLDQVFQFVNRPQLPVFSNWVVDFNAFFDTGIPVPVFNFMRPIDSSLAEGLGRLPGGTGIMAMLAARNLRRGLALGLPSGQNLSTHLGIPPLTAAELTNNLPADEVAVLTASSNLLLNKTPLWYYILRESAEREGGGKLGPLGAKIVADTFVRMLKRDGDSFLNDPAGFVPSLPSATAGNFTMADLVTFSGVTQP